jgi:hypothetical protein
LRDGPVFRETRDGMAGNVVRNEPADVVDDNVVLGDAGLLHELPQHGENEVGIAVVLFSLPGLPLFAWPFRAVFWLILTAIFRPFR